MVLSTFLAALLSISLADAAIPNGMLQGRPSIPKVSAPDRNRTDLPPLTTVYYFNQTIDHNNPDLGTFQQRYWMDWEFYQPGGPIVLINAGEVNAEGYEGYLTNTTITGMIAQQQNGAAVLLEHRFFGYSNPYDNLTSQSLALLTIQQAIDDLINFAQTVDLPMPGGDNVKPDTTPWILTGGSYAGAVASWTMVNQPGVFYAGYSSSGVVEAITDFWGYFTPILENMPQNCSSDVQAVITYLDQMYTENNTAAIQDLKDAFGLGSLSHIDDFAAALQSNLFDWQSLQPDTGAGALFYQFCDALEVMDGVNAPPTGWGLSNAITSWGSFWNNTYYTQRCDNFDPETCLGTYNPNLSYYQDVTINNAQRSWRWMVCNEVGWYQVSPPPDQPALVSRILQPIYEERQCLNWFPQAFFSPPTPTTDMVNMVYGGWNASVDKLFFANGRRDPWREATVSAEGLNRGSTFNQPIFVSDGFHCSDMIAENGAVDGTVNDVQVAALDHMNQWLAQFPSQAR